MGMLGCRVLAAVVLLVLGSLADRRGTLDYASIIGVPNGGPWGTWAWQEMCPEGTYATGFSIKVESYQGVAKDDTGLNGVRLLCTRGGPGDKRGGSGWRLPGAPPGGYLEAFSLRVEPVRSGVQDNVGATNIRFACSGGETLEGHGLSFGEYGAWSPPCEKGLCGIQTKQEPFRGTLRDNTALNDARFLCCNR